MQRRTLRAPDGRDSGVGAVSGKGVSVGSSGGYCGQGIGVGVSVRVGVGMGLPRLAPACHHGDLRRNQRCCLRRAALVETISLLSTGCAP